MSTGSLVILDRDGVINEDDDDYVRSAAAWRPLPGSVEAVSKLSCGGFRVAVATNQSGIARGLFSGAALDAMHDKLRDAVAESGGRLDCIAHCPHLPDAGLRVPQTRSRHAGRHRRRAGMRFGRRGLCRRQRKRLDRRAGARLRSRIGAHRQWPAHRSAHRQVSALAQIARV